MATENKTWAEWTDCLGNVYRPGDIVAIAIINGKSPQMVIARVEKINRVDSSGEPITKRAFVLHDKPITKTRIRRVNQYGAPGSRDQYRALSYVDVEEEYEETGEYKQVPSCTVKATPLVDSRDFHRWSKGEDGLAKAVTYRIPENIVKMSQEIV